MEKKTASNNRRGFVDGGLPVISAEMEQAYLRRYVTVCEMFLGQPERYYREHVERNSIDVIDFSRYHFLMTGLKRSIYRTFFGMEAHEYTEAFLKVEKEIKADLNERKISCITAMQIYDHSKRFVMLFSGTGHISAQEVAQYVESCFNDLYARIFDMDKIPYCNYTVLSEEIHGYENLQSTFRKMDALSHQQFFDMRTMVMTPALLEECRIPVSREQIHEDITLLRTAVRERDLQATQQTLAALFNRLGGARDFDLLGSTLHAVRALAEGMLASQGRELDDPDAFSIERYPTFDYLRTGVQEKLAEIIAGMPGGPAMSAPVLEAVRYIRHHFAEDVSLADVARHIDMSPSWLTKHFNQECRMSIPQYLLDVRMEHAKKLLAQTNKLIFEVSHAVGFENPRYFVAVFKKAVGLTPSAYREQMKKP